MGGGGGVLSGMGVPLPKAGTMGVPSCCRWVSLPVPIPSTRGCPSPVLPLLSQSGKLLLSLGVRLPSYSKQAWVSRSRPLGVPLPTSMGVPTDVWTCEVVFGLSDSPRAEIRGLGLSDSPRAEIRCTPVDLKPSMNETCDGDGRCQRHRRTVRETVVKKPVNDDRKYPSGRRQPLRRGTRRVTRRAGTKWRSRAAA